ncbi:MAG: hypothetical protein WBK62_04460 [Candidatus Fermentibacter daniensis]
MLKRSIAVALFAALPAAAYNGGYNMELAQFKETSKLTNSFSFSQEVSRNVSMNVDAAFTANRSIDLDRFVDGRTGNASLRWTPMDRIELASTVTRVIQIEERFGDTILDKVENTATGQIRYAPASWASVQIGLGFHFMDSDESLGDSTIARHDDGGVRNFNISVQKPLFSRLASSISLSENRIMGQQRENGNDDLAARMNYSLPGLFEGGSMSVEIGATRLFSTFTDSGYSQRQQDWRHSVTFTLPRFSEAVSMQVSTGWNWSKRYWEYESRPGVEDPRDRLERGRRISGVVGWMMNEDLSLDIDLSRAVDRSDKKRTGFMGGDLYDVYDIADDRRLNATLTYTPGRSSVVFQRSIQLRRYDTMGTWPGFGGLDQDNSDRDELREVLSVKAEIPVSSRLTLLGVVSGQNSETIYLKSEYSGNSRNSARYAVSPGYRYDLGSGWDVSHTLEISADYTTYRFPEVSTANDLLFRRMQSNFQFQRLSSDSTTLGFQHVLRFQDQGSFADALYSRSEESINSTLTVNSGFHMGRTIGITPSYSYEYSRRKYLASFIAPREDNLHHVGLRTRMALGSGLLSLNLTRTFYTDERPSYWNASVGFNYRF